MATSFPAASNASTTTQGRLWPCTRCRCRCQLFGARIKPALCGPHPLTPQEEFLQTRPGGAGTSESLWTVLCKSPLSRGGMGRSPQPAVKICHPELGRQLEQTCESPLACWLPGALSRQATDGGTSCATLEATRSTSGTLSHSLQRGLSDNFRSQLTVGATEAQQGRLSAPRPHSQARHLDPVTPASHSQE